MADRVLMPNPVCTQVLTWPMSRFNNHVANSWSNAIQPFLLETQNTDIADLSIVGYWCSSRHTSNYWGSSHSTRTPFFRADTNPVNGSASLRVAHQQVDSITKHDMGVIPLHWSRSWGSTSTKDEKHVYMSFRWASFFLVEHCSTHIFRSEL